MTLLEAKTRYSLDGGVIDRLHKLSVGLERDICIGLREISQVGHVCHSPVLWELTAV